MEEIIIKDFVCLPSISFVIAKSEQSGRVWYLGVGCFDRRCRKGEKYLMTTEGIIQTKIPSQHS